MKKHNAPKVKSPFMTVPENAQVLQQSENSKGFDSNWEPNQFDVSASSWIPTQVKGGTRFNIEGGNMKTSNYREVTADFPSEPASIKVKQFMPT